MAKLTNYNIKVCLVVIIAAFSFGFGASIFVTSVGQPGFYRYYDLDPTSLHTANILSAINALFFFGCAVGAIGQCFVADWIGRKGALTSSAIFSIIGSALVAGSVNIPMLFVMRIIQGVGLGMLLALVPLYLTEVAPPQHRGFLTGSTQFSTGIGYIVCSWGSLGCYHAENLTVSWRLPLALACVGPIALYIGLLFVPESPRYLIWKGKKDEAWAILKRLHHDPSNPSEADASAEFTQILRQVEMDKEENPTFWKMFKVPSWRRRSISVLFLLWIYGITNFFPLLIGSLGLTGDVPLILYASYTTVATISIFITMWLVDRFGRRVLLLTGFASVACILFTEALLQWKYQGTSNKAGNNACIFFIFMFIAFFQCIDAPTFVWAAEIFPTTLRAKGVSLAIFAYFAGTITFSTPAPVALQSIKWGMFLIYAGLCVISFVITYFYIPETKGLPVEEIGALFGDTVAVHLTADGEGIVEEKPEEGQVEDNALHIVQKV
ncbi:uncharacterized protein A1O9_06247 [Exophiala aquamarina CBS 119918]|uniref:Major facilitator superfamily (MFS) profile domain-containing protein n=1 Tax=Exophiala aquamarina CBS 119918 TaxID=1182545 RepID=A0A072PER0_9EURO|nr:uncharacterized protein A1O9_06247 [Exophiala aquamarina CBS 119918]KEF58321.1 hypothetical protein A1O9_06247 [Exophiala aquamarina CBS 119918]